MPPMKRARKEESEAEEVELVQEEEVDLVQEETAVDIGDENYIVVIVIKTLEPSEPDMRHIAFKMGENCFPSILNRMLKNTPELQFKIVMPGSQATSSELDYLLMNASEDGVEGFDYPFQNSHGERIKRKHLLKHIEKMFEVVESKGYASARQMQVAQKRTFLEARWVTVHVTEA